MMEILDKIYGYEHFGIILFAVIAFLVVLFLIVLFFGKKDEKKRELERTQQLAAQQTTDAFAPVNADATAINVKEPIVVPTDNVVAPVANDMPTVDPVVAQVVPEVQVVPQPVAVEPVIPVVEPVVAAPIAEPVAPVLQPVVEPSIVMPTAPVEPVAPVMPVASVVPEVQVAPIVEPVVMPLVEAPVAPKVEEPLPEIEIPNFNFDELAASIANELNSLEKNNKPEVEIPSSMATPEVPVSAPVTPISEVVKPTPGPVTFSSVYINKPAAPVEPVAPAMPVNEAPVVQTPEIELPKPAEMPALNKNVQNDIPVSNPTPVVPDFSQFEGESYDIK